MILFFRTPSKSVIAVECDHELTQADSDKLCWLFGEATPESEDNLKGHFVGPRREMITPWSTNAVEITQNMGLESITRIEEYFPVKDENAEYDPMLQRMYKGLDQNVFTTNRQPEPIVHIEDLEAYNEKEGLALSREEMDYLLKVEKDLGRKLTDSEVFGFAQINSEHCRHKTLRRNIHHRWSGTGIFTLPNDKEDHTRESQQDYLCLQRQCGLCRRSGYRTVCSGRPLQARLFPSKGHQECHLPESGNT